MLNTLFHKVAENLWPVCSIIVFLGGSIFIHELGHFLAARWRGVRALRFSVGFGPKIFGWTDRHGTEWRLSWLPLGGYVALPQLADMGDLEGGNGQEWEKLPPISYTDKLIVAVMGAAFNLLLAVALASVLWQIGRPVPEDLATTRVGYVSKTMVDATGKEVPSPAAVAGVQVGDTIRSIDGRPVTDWLGVKEALILGTGVANDGSRVAHLSVERKGRLLEIAVNPLRGGDENVRRIGIAAAYDVIVDTVEPASAAARLGLQAGDRLQSLGDRTLYGLGDLAEILDQASGDRITLGIRRGELNVSLPMSLPPKDRQHLFTGAEFVRGFRLVYQTPWDQVAQFVGSSFRTLWSLVSPRGDLGLGNLSGFVAIGGGFWDAAKSDWPFRFGLWFAVMVNVSLAIFNLMPIPVLDGGQMVFATIARLRGRPIPFNVVATIQSIFVVLLLSLMLYVTVGDFRRLARDNRPVAEEKPTAPDAPAAAPAPTPTKP